MTDKQLILALRQCEHFKLSGHCEKCEYEMFASCDRRLCAEASLRIEKLLAENAALREKVPQWISVEARLPKVWKKEDDVLINYMIYSPDFGVDIGNYHAKAKRWLCMSLPCTVTHWMPLPEGPKEGGST